jgi:hypothetical protein
MSVENPNLLEKIRTIENRLDSLEKRVSKLESILKRFPSPEPGPQPYKPGKGPEPFRF